MKLILIFLFGVLLPISGLAEEKPTYQVKEYRESHTLGLKRDPLKHKAFLESLPKHAVMRDTAIPGKFDLTALVSPPENQGSCGSCWDFSLTKALRSALMLAGKDPGRLAFNYLLNNCSGVSEANEYGCNGGDFAAGNGFLNGRGPWLESQDPYRQTEGRCMSGLQVAGTALEMVQIGGDSPSFQLLAGATSQRHMSSIDVAVAGSWGNYSGGVYNGDGSGINHMIDLVGYDCETSVDSSGNCQFNSRGEPVNGDGFLKVQNNWGTWGENGYMRTRAHRNEIATTAVYFRVKEVPQPVDGGWSEYGAWSACIDNHESRTRTCTNPTPSNGGKQCIGPDSEVRGCDVPVPPVPMGKFPWLIAIVAAVIGLLTGALVVSLIKKS